MFIIKLLGGLGNQMFQYSFGKALGLKYDHIVKFDLSFFENSKKRKFELDLFDLNLTIASKEEIFYHNYKKNLISRLINKNFDRFFPLNFRLKIKEKSLVFDKRIYNHRYKKNKRYYFEGYWQNINYFQEFEKEIKKDFIFKYPLNAKSEQLKKIIISKESISIHIRRGDYLNDPLLNSLDISYYKNAVELILSKIPNASFFIFSDDINWAKDNLKFNNEMLFIDFNIGKDSWQDLALMSLCKHNIIANSSFSWQAAWLNNNPDKIVIAPINWFKDKNIKHDIIPENWQKL